jgi:tellurite resistance protein
VLAEITQAREWRVPEDDARVPGLAELKTADPAFSVQHIEDRVSVMFWRLRAAEFFGDASYANPVASTRFISEFSAGLARPARQFSLDAAVGKVELLELGHDADLDRLKVAVRWSGVLCEGDPRGSHREVRSKAIRTQVFELVRKPGVPSQAGTCFSSASCSQCGAPIAVTSEAACTFCGAKLTDGRYDWVLDSVARWSPQIGSRDSDALTTAPIGTGPAFGVLRSASRPQTELSLAVLARMVAADGQIDPRERAALLKLGARRGLTGEQVDVVLNTAVANEIELPVPNDPREAGDYLQQMVAVSLADGNVSAPEQKLLMVFARRMNLSVEDVRLEIARQRKARFQAAKSFIKQSKRGSA